ncbi:unnamed protein product [Adineta steineri]|uniref:G-protein coupled receptors family 1 profile domain-containing protein n=1 Tax=Adineta steineri TaxID=433720 RepID=A0A815JUX5_9BILA|nr:unnamed protein product [Adineta steineri]CAF3871633.1 unnamed protein product [Adineta steineri]
MNNTSAEFIRVYIISRYFYLIIFVIGMLGNIFNLVVFCRKKFRSNSCSLYFIAYSINNFMNLTIGLLLWSLTLGFHYDWEYKILIYCKIRRYFTHVNFLLSSCLLTMASINRYARVRQAQLTENRDKYILFCKRRTTYIIIISIIIFCLIANIHIPIFFELHHGACYARDGTYHLLFDIFFLIFYAILPPLSMIIINIATVIQIRRIKRLVHPTVSRREYHLILLVITHSVSNAIFTLPFTINKFIYYMCKNRITEENNQLAFTITLLIAFMNPGLSFYLYTLTTPSFRDEFIRACRDVLKKIKLYLSHRNAINNQTQQPIRDDSIFSLSMVSQRINSTSSVSSDQS